MGYPDRKGSEGDYQPFNSKLLGCFSLDHSSCPGPVVPAQAQINRLRSHSSQWPSGRPVTPSAALDAGFCVSRRWERSTWPEPLFVWRREQPRSPGLHGVASTHRLRVGQGGAESFVYLCLRDRLRVAESTWAPWSGQSRCASCSVTNLLCSSDPSASISSCVTLDKPITSLSLLPLPCNGITARALKAQLEVGRHLEMIKTSGLQTLPP